MSITATPTLPIDNSAEKDRAAFVAEVFGFLFLGLGMSALTATVVISTAATLLGSMFSAETASVLRGGLEIAAVLGYLAVLLFVLVMRGAWQCDRTAAGLTFGAVCVSAGFALSVVGGMIPELHTTPARLAFVLLPQAVNIALAFACGYGAPMLKALHQIASSAEKPTERGRLAVLAALHLTLRARTPVESIRGNLTA